MPSSGSSFLLISVVAEVSEVSDALVDALVFSVWVSVVVVVVIVVVVVVSGFAEVCFSVGFADSAGLVGSETAAVVAAVVVVVVVSVGTAVLSGVVAAGLTVVAAGFAVVVSGVLSSEKSISASLPALDSSGLLSGVVSAESALLSEVCEAAVSLFPSAVPPLPLHPHISRQQTAAAIIIRLILFPFIKGGRCALPPVVLSAVSAVSEVDIKESRR